MTDQVIRKEYLTRDKFKALFRSIFGKEYPDTLKALIEHAEDMRDTGMHGHATTQPDMRKAIHDVFAYAQQFNAYVEGIAAFKPFGDLRGFKGRAENLDKTTTRWILKGIGFTIG